MANAVPQGRASLQGHHDHHDVLGRRRGTRRYPVPPLQLASEAVEPLVLLLGRWSGAAVRRLRRSLEYFFYEGPLPTLQPPVAMDIMPSLRAVVVACRLVRAWPG